MIKVEKEAGIWLNEAFYHLGAGYNKASEICSTAEKLRGHQIDWNICCDWFDKGIKEGVLESESEPRMGKKGPYRDGSQDIKYRIIDFESFAEKHIQNMNNEYVQKLIS